MFFSKPDNDEVAKRGMLHALGAFLYILAVVTLVSNLQRFFGDRPDPKFLAPLAMLSLLVLSAAVMGMLVFGKPVMLYIDGKKKEAVAMVCWTVGTFAVITVAVFAFMAGRA
ncbi:MAG TPA: hypothetical protein VL426_02910 [Candidatus Binatia bacterium]|jgi:hypothetical protein|nr:hypothetical protein [Candidatus Binatia bacterium]